MAFNAYTRRGILGAMAIAPAIITSAAAAPTFATSKFAISHARHAAAARRFNALPEDLEYTDTAAFDAEEQRYQSANDDLDRATPTNLHELVQLMEHTIGSGMYPGREMCDLLIGHARRLAG